MLHKQLPLLSMETQILDRHMFLILDCLIQYVKLAHVKYITFKLASLDNVAFIPLMVCLLLSRKLLPWRKHLLAAITLVGLGGLGRDEAVRGGVIEGPIHGGVDLVDLDVVLVVAWGKVLPTFRFVPVVLGHALLVRVHQTRPSRVLVHVLHRFGPSSYHRIVLVLPFPSS